MKKLLTKLSPIGMLMDDPDKLKYVSPIAMLLSSGNKDKDNKNQTNQVTRQTEQAKQQSFKKGGQIKKEPLKNNLDKGMEADTTGPLKERKVKNNDMDSPDYTPATPMEIYQGMRPVKNNKKLPKEMKRNKDGSVTTSDGYTYSSFSKALNSPDDFLEYNKKDTSKKSTTTKKKSGGKVGKKKAGCRKGYGKAMRGY